jgi:hypothetical protein
MEICLLPLAICLPSDLVFRRRGLLPLRGRYPVRPPGRRVHCGLPSRIRFRVKHSPGLVIRLGALHPAGLLPGCIRPQPGRLAAVCPGPGHRLAAVIDPLRGRLPAVHLPPGLPPFAAGHRRLAAGSGVRLVRPFDNLPGALRRDRRPGLPHRPGFRGDAGQLDAGHAGEVLGVPVPPRDPVGQAPALPSGLTEPLHRLAFPGKPLPRQPPEFDAFTVQVPEAADPGKFLAAGQAPGLIDGNLVLPPPPNGCPGYPPARFPETFGVAAAEVALPGLVAAVEPAGIGKERVGA